MIGLLEGEGCFTPNRLKNKTYVRIQVESTDRDVIERLVPFGGRVCGPIQRGRNVKHNATWKWAIYGPECRDLLERILPYMSVRRQGQISAALEESLALR